MKRFHFDIVIKAPVEKVWESMLGDSGYRTWTRVFSEGSYFKGEWKTGAKIFFLAPFEGSEGGMVSHIKEAVSHSHVKIEHLGMIENGVEDTTSEKVKPWAGAEENYFFKEHTEGTELRIETDMDEQHVEFFERVTGPCDLEAELRGVADAGHKKPGRIIRVFCDPSQFRDYFTVRYLSMARAACRPRLMA